MPDVLIIGAGIVGCAAGEALARQGASVGFIDPHGVGLGATQASAGMLTPYKEGLHHPVLEALGLRSLWLWDAFVDRLFDGRSPGHIYARNGSLDVAMDDAEAEELQTFAHAHEARGVASRYLKGGDAKQLERDITADCVGALLMPAHGYANAPAVAGGALAGLRVARRTGDARERHAHSADRERAHRSHQRGPAVCADGRACRRQLGGADRHRRVDPLPVHPVRGQLLYLKWPEPALSHIVWGSRCYAVPWPDGTLLVGATLEDVGFDARATVAGVRDLLDSMCELLPRAWQAGFLGARVGLRPGSPDALPIIGRSSRVRGLVYATGHYRNGVLLAPLTARPDREIIRGDESDPALPLVSPSRLGDY